MTIAAGFCCSDGVILAADTLITLPGGGRLTDRNCSQLTKGKVLT